MTYEAIGQPVAGLIINNDGSFTFDPTQADYDHIAQDATDDVTVNYRVTDSNNATGDGSFVVRITGVNDPPVAIFNAQQDVLEDDQPISGQLTATDADDQAVLTYSLVGAVEGLTINLDGTFSFDPADSAYDGLNPGEVQTIPVTYSVTDGLASVNGTFNIEITGV